MVARVVRVNWRTNISARVIARLFVPAPRERLVTRVNWWNVGSNAESGNVLASSQVALTEGPLPPGSDLDAFDQNALRDEDGLNVLVQSTWASSTGTNSNAAGRPSIPHFEFPGGVWTVEDLWLVHRVDTGVKNFWSSIGFEQLRISQAEWLDLRRHSPNTSNSGELLQ